MLQVKPLKNVMYQIAYKHIDPRRPYEVEDMVQEMLYRAWKGYDTFKEESTFFSWFYSVCKCAAIDYKRRVDSRIKTICLHNIFFDIEQDDNAAILKQRHQQTQSIIGSLSEPERKLVFLYIEGKSYEEIEVITGYNQNRLRVKIARIKDKLKKQKPPH